MRVFTKERHHDCDTTNDTNDITLRNRPGKGYTDIGSFWNARSRYTILARDLAGKSGLRFGGNVLAWKTVATLDLITPATPRGLAVLAGPRR